MCGLRCSSDVLAFSVSYHVDYENTNHIMITEETKFVYFARFKSREKNQKQLSHHEQSTKTGIRFTKKFYLSLLMLLKTIRACSTIPDIANASSKMLYAL